MLDHKENSMNHTYKMIEVVGSADKSYDEAIRSAIDKASNTIRNMRWFEVTDMRGNIEANKVTYWQVTLKIGFTVEE